MHPIRNFRFAARLVLGLAVALAACDSPTEPRTVASVSGSYRATTFTLVQEGSTVDLLQQGAELDLRLDPNGTTAGRIVVPNGDEDGGDFDADLTGQWTLKGDTVRFQHAADTFVRDMPFLVRGSRLEGDETFGGARIRVVLEK